MASILSIINELELTSKRLIKENILRKNAQNDSLKKVFWACYNPDITWWIKKHPIVKNYNGTMTISEAIDLMLHYISERVFTGNQAIEYYQAILTNLTDSDAIILKRIINRDLRCGVSVSTINKIWKNLIPTYEVMLASTDKSTLQFPHVCCQVKLDGIRINITRIKDDFVFKTRNGSTVEGLDCLHDSLIQIIKDKETWDGELVCFYNDKPLERKISNGILNKAIRGTISEKEANLINFICWDIVDKTQSIPYHQRFAQIQQRLNDTSLNKIKAVQSWNVSTLEEVEQIFSSLLIKGEEGVIAKNLNSVWQPKRVKDLVKFKAEKTADLKVIDWEEGTGKYKGKLGALVCETKDGKIRVNVGSGFSDIQREEFTKKYILDKIVEIKYNEIIDNSLYLPRFLQIRNDKNEANNFDEL